MDIPLRKVTQLKILFCPFCGAELVDGEFVDCECEITWHRYGETFYDNRVFGGYPILVVGHVAESA